MAEKKPIMSKRTFNIISITQCILVIIILGAILAYHFGIAVVPSLSMYPTLKVRTIVCYDITDPEDLTYDDIVLFFPSGNVEINNGFDVLYYQRIMGETVFVKRVIGLPGDVIEVKDGYAWRNGEKLDPEYVTELMEGTMEPYTVPEGTIFCMGDNRNNSVDSRFYGPFEMDSFIGKALFHFDNIFAD